VLRSEGADIAIGRRDRVILALPAQATAALLPDLVLPGAGRPILNAHFVVPESGLPPILGILGGAAQWLFRRGDVVAATVSAADASPLAGMGRDAALARLWAEVSAAVAAHGGAVPEGFRPAASCANGRRPSTSRPEAWPGGTRPRRAGATCLWPATMSPPACPQHSRAR
jgi:hydroxysqualene dehydroxylase